jgi:hypothetical protein
VHLFEGAGVDGVHPEPPLAADPDQPGLPEDSEMLREGGLGDLEPPPQIPDGPFAVSQEIQDPAPGRLGQGPIDQVV